MLGLRFGLGPGLERELGLAVEMELDLGPRLRRKLRARTGPGLGIFFSAIAQLVEHRPIRLCDPMPRVRTQHRPTP